MSEGGNQSSYTVKSYHFIAIGGAVMHNLALELLAHGHQITGSDDEIFDPARTRLKNAGILPADLGWFPEKIHTELDGIILGMHARADNPELKLAQELGIRVYSFPEFIYEHSRNKKRIVIGGSHGKTTCTAMLMHVLQHCGMDFDYLVGSQLQGFERMVRISHAPLIVIEGDEYLTSTLHPVPKFHVYKPHLAMLTGIAWDHVNVFPTFGNYLEQFRIFLQTLEPGAKTFWFGGDEHLNQLAEELHLQGRAYTEPRYEVSEEGTTVYIGDRTYALRIFGRHNLQNAAGVALLAAELGISEHAFWQAMQNFGGTARRLEKMAETDTCIVYRDFAHAPSKVKATVQAVREQYPGRRLIAVFEVHTFSSLQPGFMREYGGTLAPADAAFVLFDPHVFALKKMQVPEASEIESAFGVGKAFSQTQELREAVKNELQKGPAVLLLMSSGNFGGLLHTDFF
ncbi:MAG: peptidoglycan synthetase [Bacteroidetes bacterium]|nr:peptidoglycan synthetase [Bacteroidota bacterium]